VDKCRGIWGRIFGHKFVARYDRVENGPDTKTVIELLHRGNMTIVLENDLELVNLLRSYKDTYVHDICVRCGVVVEKKT